MNIEEKFSPFVEVIKKQKKTSAIVGSIFIIFTAGISFIPSSTSKEFYIKIGIIAFFALISLVILSTAFTKIENFPVLKVLREDPQKIVWHYIQRNKKNGNHISSLLILNCNQGKSYQMGIPLGREREFANLTCKFCPQAISGYSTEIQYLYREDPLNFLGNFKKEDLKTGN